MKRCSQCGEIKSLEDFSRNRRMTSGRASACKACTKLKARAYYESHVQEHVDRAKKWRQENPEANLAARRRYNEKHKELHNRLSREWYQKNREQARANMLAWREKNPEQFARNNREHRHRRRARERGGRVTPVDALVIYTRDAGICHLCGLLVAPEDFSLDHIDPIALGGAHTPENVRTAHLVCNMRRGTSPVALTS